MATMATKEDVNELRTELRAEIRAEHKQIAPEIQFSILMTFFCVAIAGGGVPCASTHYCALAEHCCIAPPNPCIIAGCSI